MPAPAQAPLPAAQSFPALPATQSFSPLPATQSFQLPAVQSFPTVVAATGQQLVKSLGTPPAPLVSVNTGAPHGASWAPPHRNLSGDSNTSDTRSTTPKKRFVRYELKSL